MGTFELGKLTEFLSAIYSHSELFTTRNILFILGIIILILIIHTYIYLRGSEWILKWYRAQKIQESERPSLFSILENLSSKAQVKTPKIYSFESEIPSMFTIGNSTNSSIVISTSMLRIFNDLELEALIAHEIGHIKCKHVYTNTVAALLAGTLTSFPNFVVTLTTISGFGQSEDLVPRFFKFFITALVAPPAAIIVHLTKPEKRELAADEEAVKLTRDPLKLAKVFEFLENYIPLQPVTSKFNLAHFHLFSTHTQQMRGYLSIFVFLFDTHPETADRITKIISHSEYTKNATLYSKPYRVPGFFDVKKCRLALGISLICYIFPMFLILFAYTYISMTFNAVINAAITLIYAGATFLLIGTTAKFTKAIPKYKILSKFKFRSKASKQS